MVNVIEDPLSVIPEEDPVNLIAGIEIECSPTYKSKQKEDNLLHFYKRLKKPQFYNQNAPHI